MSKANESKSIISLESIDLRRNSYGEDKGMSGTARFSNGSVYNSEHVEINIKLTPEQISLIVTACGNSLQEYAKKQAEAFYQSSQEIAANVIAFEKSKQLPETTI